MSMKQKYWSKAFMDDSGRKIESICKYMPYIMDLTYIQTEK